MEELLAGLNAQQRCAVTSPATVLQVLAPPGSGKTKTLTSRVAYLLSHRGLKPWNIIVCTFTIKAAREMKERIRGMAGNDIEGRLLLGTFHSVARRFLVTYGHYIGIEKSFGIADSSDTLAIIKRIVKRRSYGIEPSTARSRISGLKARNTSPDEYLAAQKTVEQQEFASLYSEYEETLKASKLLDYDDLLLRCCDLLRKRPESVSNIESVLIDEFQDTNHIQYELMCLFAQRHRNITIVGDPDQSIYGFRSAEIKNLRRMQTDYNDTLVVHLEENYRSSASILHSAVEVIEQDEARPAKKLLPTHGAGEQPVLRKLPSAAAEAQWLVTEIKRAKNLTGHLFAYNDFSVLLRSAALSRHIETAMGRAGIPYRMVGGHRFFDRVEIKLILDYLRVINQPTHNDALVRIINVPSRKIGDVTVKNLLEEAEAEKLSLWELVLGAAQGKKRPKTKLSAQTQKGIDGFVNVILTSQRKLCEPDTSSCFLVDLIAHVFRKLSFEEYIKKSYPEDFDGRWANVEELIAQAQDISSALANGDLHSEESLPLIEGLEQNELLGPQDLLNRFLANVALATDVQTEGQSVDQVTISTIHAAKGLEWPVVFIPAAYQGSIPHSRAEDTDEERRLLYVGMTRAQAMLYLSCPMKTSQKEDAVLSPFLSHKNTTLLFATKGPAFGYATTLDFARILRRECPPETFVMECRSNVEHLKDDFWPENGEELLTGEANSSFSDTSNGRFSTASSAYAAHLDKRRQADGFVTSVTMQEAQSFSISSTTLSSGFMSAGARMREIETQEETVKADQRLSKLKRPAEPTRSAPISLKRKSSNQGNIANFFARPKPYPVSNPAREASEAPTKTLSALPIKRAGQTIYYPSQPTDKSTLETTPFSLGTHKVRISTNGPRSFAESEEIEPSTRYVLLSSSPTKPDDDGSKPPPDSYSPCRDTRPAATFHATSVAKLNRNEPGQRKTLGVRRSMQGWSSKAHRPFSAPRRPL